MGFVRFFIWQSDVLLPSVDCHCAVPRLLRILGPPRTGRRRGVFFFGGGGKCGVCLSRAMGHEAVTDIRPPHSPHSLLPNKNPAVIERSVTRERKKTKQQIIQACKYPVIVPEVSEEFVCMIFFATRMWAEKKKKNNFFDPRLIPGQSHQMFFFCGQGISAHVVSRKCCLLSKTDPRLHAKDIFQICFRFMLQRIFSQTALQRCNVNFLARFLG